MAIDNGKPQPRSRHIDIVFDRPPGPVSPQFIEVENDIARSITFGCWLQRPDGYWVLRFTAEDAVHWLGVADE